MKCAAEAVRFLDRYNSQHEAYGTMLIDFIQTVTIYYAASAYSWYRQGRNAQDLIDRIVEDMEQGVSGATPMHIRKVEGGKKWWADEYERNGEAITDEILRMREHFRAAGFRDVNLLDMEPGNVEASKRPTQREARRNGPRIARLEYFSSRGRDAARLWTYNAYCEIEAEEYATGRPRFSVEKIDGMIYAPYAAEIRVWWERFLSGTEAAQNENKRRQAAIERRVREEFGIELESEVEIAKRKKAAENVKKIPPEIAKAFEDAMQPGGFGGAVRFR